ncbi:MAG TPA: hypothetical protein GX530_07030 [Corynebacteriales bacterium]|nr:hypothetical protein [Mycobacteriales bacterium]
MASAKLPDDPRGIDFEEYVAAVCQAAGLYTELNLIERETVELLQLDVLTTDYSVTPPFLRIIEAKSGKNWGSTDLFKIRGAMHHLGVTAGAFAVREERDGLEIYKDLAEEMDIIFVHAPECEKEHIAELVSVEDVHDADIWAWRFSYRLQRKMLDDLRRWRKLAAGVKGSEAVLRYAFEITSGIFFTATVADRVSRLYDAYSENRDLAARCAAEIEIGDFIEGAKEISPEIFRRTFYKHEYNPVQVATMIEHQSRLALLKAAVDYQMCIEGGIIDRAYKTWRIIHGQNVHEIPAIFFPTRFEDALQEIMKEPYFRRYPLLWQNFLGIFGGFILLDYEEEEYKLLSKRSGIPVDAIPQAFAVYDKLFPVDGGWFIQPKLSNIRLLKLYPSPMRGIGANFKRVMYADPQEFEQLKLSGLYTRSDLIAWNNVAARVLTT